MSFIAKKVGRKYFSNQAAAYEPRDPHYEEYVDERGRTKQRKRAMPEGLSKRDQKILRSVRRRAHYLDKGFSICGFRFGWTAIIGIIPFAGDVVGFLLSYFLVLRKCRQAELPVMLQQRMGFNQAVGSGMGLIPLVGDICLAVWKANSRNAALLEEFLISRAAKQNEETAGQAAIDSVKIDRRTGERTSASTAGAGTLAGGTGSIQATGSGTGTGSNEHLLAANAPPKKKYGWNGGAKTADSQPASSTTTTTTVTPSQR